MPQWLILNDQGVVTGVTLDPQLVPPGSQLGPQMPEAAPSEQPAARPDIGLGLPPGAPGGPAGGGGGEAGGTPAPGGPPPPQAAPEAAPEPVEMGGGAGGGEPSYPLPGKGAEAAKLPPGWTVESPATPAVAPATGEGAKLPPGWAVESGGGQGGEDQTPPSWGHTAGLAVAKFGEGIPLGVTGLLDLGNLGLSKVGIDTGFKPGSASEWVGEKYRGLGLPEPKSRGERYLAALSSGAGGVLPTLALGGVGAALRAPALARVLLARPVAQFAGGAGAGAGGQIGAEANLSGPAQFGLGLVGGVLGHGAGAGVGSAFRGAKAGVWDSKDAKAGGALLQMAQDPVAARAALQNAPISPRGFPGAARTTGQYTMDPGILRYEDAVQQRGGAGTRLAAIGAQRNEQVARALQTMRPAVPRDAGQRGRVVRSAMTRMERAVAGRTDQLYEAARRVGGTYRIDSVQRAAARARDKYYGPGSGGSPAEFRSIAKQIAAAGNTASNEWLINMDRQLGNLAGQAAVSGDRTLAAALGEVRTAVEQAHNNPQLAAARAHRRLQGQLTERDPTGQDAAGKILAEAKFGMPRMLDEKVAARAIQDPSSTRQILALADEAIRSARASGASPAELRALATTRAELRGVLREAFAEEANAKTLSAATPVVGPPGRAAAFPTISTAQYKTFWRDKRAVAEQLYSRGEMQTLEQLADQLAESAEATQGAKPVNSATAQRLAHLQEMEHPSLAHVLMAMSSGRIGIASEAVKDAAKYMKDIARIGGGAIGGGLGWGVAGPSAEAVGAGWIGQKVAGALAEMPGWSVHALMQDALVDPQLAKRLVNAVDAKNMQWIIQHAAQHPNSAFGRLVMGTAATAVAPAGAVEGETASEPGRKQY